MVSLVTNMGDPKNPWDDVPIEVLIEYERQKREEAEKEYQRIRLPIPSLPSRPPEKDKPRDPIEDSGIIVIKLI